MQLHCVKMSWATYATGLETFIMQTNTNLSMTNYDLFAKHYDEVMGDRSDDAAELQKLISKHNPRAKTILELACGTGSVLQHFEKRYDVYGLDLSPGMLALARKKVPSGKILFFTGGIKAKKEEKDHE